MVFILFVIGELLIHRMILMTFSRSLAVKGRRDGMADFGLNIGKLALIIRVSRFYF